ncbi:DUF2628 domain-containing protein [Methylovorus menthalis]|uniref:pilin n=1 Tax=Methylovorus menthalis TaxID=1002227 RepID=UPI001E2E280A|nr:pilin [Methylovorus menthalis]MCB4809921.1 DUF2628 domain-containing protein [Methylovorus menthalis]
MYCPACGTSNDPSALFCLKCGNPLPPVNQVQPEPTEPSLEEYYTAVIGPQNTAYYLNKFQKFDALGKTSAGWHWPAFFITFYWGLYRKMWRNALIYFLSPYLVAIAVGILGIIGGNSPVIPLIVGLVYVAYLLGAWILPGIYGDALYYKHCKKLIEKVKASTPDHQRQLGELTGRGGTSGAALWVFLVLFFVAFIGILAAIAVPAYQAYTTRAKTAQAYQSATEAAQSVEAYYVQHQALPLTIYEAGFTGTLPSAVKEIRVDQKNGALIVTMASMPLTDKSFSLWPSKDGNAVVWRCASLDITDDFLPKNCRAQR